MGTSAKVIADSISHEGVRLTTAEIVMHRFVLAEFNTHRVFSRNSASSRAIPVQTQIKRLSQNPAFPVAWPAEQKGMQGGAELEGEAFEKATLMWSQAYDWTRDHVSAYVEANPEPESRLHKSLVNRLLEPYMWHTVVVTSTAYQNWDTLRLDTDAQPEIRKAAEALVRARAASTPRILGEGEWHLPYVEAEDWKALTKLVAIGKSMYPEMTKISSARCARTSYLTQDGRRDLTEDLRLYGDLVDKRIAAKKGVHWSPLEHVATPWPQNRQGQGLEPQLVCYPVHGGLAVVPTDHLPRVGNLLGWRQLRTEVEAVNNARTFA